MKNSRTRVVKGFLQGAVIRKDGVVGSSWSREARAIYEPVVGNRQRRDGLVATDYVVIDPDSGTRRRLWTSDGEPGYTMRLKVMDPFQEVRFVCADPGEF